MGILKGIAYAVMSIIILGALAGVVAILGLIGAASGAIFLGLGVVGFVALCLKEVFEGNDDSSK